MVDFWSDEVSDTNMVADMMAATITASVPRPPLSSQSSKTF